MIILSWKSLFLFFSHDTINRVTILSLQYLYLSPLIYTLRFKMVSIGMTTLFYAGTGPSSRKDLPIMVSH
jgi:hypothetical protein